MLSKVDIFDIRNNYSSIDLFPITVVNCSQKLISLIFGTTYSNGTRLKTSLWIALKSWYLWYSEQPFSGQNRTRRCCELLSKVDIFDIRNNTPLLNLWSCGVVNCSQKLISLIFGTTEWGGNTPHFRLWIALKSWYLWYSEQPTYMELSGLMSCELLSKVDIFDIRNNKSLKIK